MIARILALGLVWLFAVSSPLMARPAEPDIVRMMLDSFEKQQGFRPAYDSIEESGGKIIVRGLKFTPPGLRQDKDVPDITLGTLTLLNPRVDDGGLYHVDRMEMRNLRLTDKSDKAVRVTIPLGVAEDVSFLPKSAARDARERSMAGGSFFSSLRIDEIFIEGKEIPARLVWRDVKLAWQGNRRNGEGTFKGDLGKLTIPSEVLNKIPGGNPLKDLGYDSVTFTAGLDYDAKWEKGDIMRMDLSMRTGMENAGMNEIAVTGLGMPLALIESLKDIKAKSKGDPDRAEKEMLDAFNKHMGDLTILGARISWIDKSLANRLIDYMAKKKGISREAYIANLTVYPQILLMQIGLPSLAAQASDQLRTFLNDPKSLSISFKAKAPMSFATMMTLFSDPAGLAETLGLKVEANTLK